jgi:hypothetical protein
MKLVELIENLSLDQDPIPDSIINQAIRENYSDRDITHLIEVFLRGIGSSHRVPGDCVQTLWGIQDYYCQHHQLTPRQRVYVTHKILDHWHQLGVEMRAILGL